MSAAGLVKPNSVQLVFLSALERNRTVGPKSGGPNSGGTLTLWHIYVFIEVLCRAEPASDCWKTPSFSISPSPSARAVGDAGPVPYSRSAVRAIHYQIERCLEGDRTVEIHRHRRIERISGILPIHHFRHPLHRVDDLVDPADDITENALRIVVELTADLLCRPVGPRCDRHRKNVREFSAGTALQAFLHRCTSTV